MDKFPFDPYDFFGYLSSGIVILFGLNLTLGIPPMLWADPNPFQIFIIGLAAYIIGQISATPSKWLLESLIVGYILRTPSINLMDSHKSKSFWIFRLLFPGYYHPLSEEVTKSILAKTQSEGLLVTEGESLFLHIRYSNSIRTDQKLMDRLGSFLNKYGFNRNLCFVAFVFGLTVLMLTPFDIASEQTRYALLSVVGSFLLFYRYLKFFRQYSYELFNTYARQP